MNSLKNMNEQKKITRVASIIILITIMAAVIGAMLFDFPKYYQLSRYGIETQGTIISKEKENHMYISFNYEVRNQIFKSGGRAEDIGKNFESVQLNEKVQVYYDPNNPEIATLGNPSKQLKSSIFGICFVSIIPTLFLVGYELKKRFKL